MGLLSRTLRGRTPATDAGLAPANVAPTWTDRATFSAWEAPCGWVRGGRQYQPGLQAVAGPPRDGGYLVPVEVTFVRDLAHPHDPTALWAEVRGHLVGYLVPEIAEMLAPSLDRRGVSSSTCCGLIRGGSYAATSLAVHVWPTRRPAACVEIDVEDLRGARASWPPPEGEGIPRTQRREPRATRPRSRFVADAGGWASTG